MARGITAWQTGVVDRRDHQRVGPEETPWRRVAILRPGLEVVVLNLSHGGALVESSSRLSPGARTELQLSGITRHVIRGRIDRCRVKTLDPICYEGAIVFDERLDWHASPALVVCAGQ